MLFSQIASVALFFLTFGSAVASPVADTVDVVERQSDTDIVSVLNTLQASTGTILPQLSTSCTISPSFMIVLIYPRQPLSRLMAALVMTVSPLSLTSSLMLSILPLHRLAD